MNRLKTKSKLKCHHGTVFGQSRNEQKLFLYFIYHSRPPTMLTYVKTFQNNQPNLCLQCLRCNKFEPADSDSKLPVSLFVLIFRFNTYIVCFGVNPLIKGTRWNLVFVFVF